MNRRKHVTPLTPPVRERLLEHEGDGGKARRHRLKAQAIRLSAKGLAIGEIASVCEQSRGTISRWIDRWESQGFAFFTGRPRGRRPPRLKPEQAAAVLGWAGEEPRSKRRLCERVEREFRIRVSPGTIGRLLFRGNTLFCALSTFFYCQFKLFLPTLYSEVVLTSEDPMVDLKVFP